MTTATIEGPELLTKSDVAKLIQVSGRQVELLVKAGRLPAPIRLGTHPRWRRAALLAWLDAVGTDSAQG
jgi:excisionase family DNA binding protein